MHSVTRQVEINVRVTSEPESLGKLMATTVTCGAEVLASCYQWDDSGAVVKLVTEDGQRTTRALEAAGFKCESKPIVLVEMPDKPGLAAVLGSKLTADGVKVLYSYSFRSERGHAYAVFKTTNDSRAIYTLELCALVHELAAAKAWCPPVETDIEESHVMTQAA
jgi:hypothetical protein